MEILGPCPNLLDQNLHLNKCQVIRVPGEVQVSVLEHQLSIRMKCVRAQFNRIQLEGAS